MWLTRISINNPVFAAMMMLALMVLGVFSYHSLSVEEFPNVEFPFVIVSTNYPGASPEVVESDITRKVEDAVNTISGVKRVFSTSYEGRSFVGIEFFLNVPTATAVQDVRDKVALVKTQFRSEIREPVIERYDPGSVPVMSLAFTSDSWSEQQLSTYIDQKVVKRLQTVPGVGTVDVIGAVKREVRVHVRPERLAAYGVGMDQLLATLRLENQELPAGTVELANSEQTVQIKGRLQRPEDFRRLIVATRNGAPVYLEQVADIEDGAQDLESVAMIDGRRTVSLDVVKMSGANTIEVVDKGRETLRELQATLPPEVHMQEVANNADSIRASLADVRKTLVEGALLAILIVFLFLGSWRSTVITGLTLPISLLGTVFALFFFGFTINMMTLMALSLCIGLLVDDAIVVRENIVRHGSMGKSPWQAAMDGTQEIGLAVLATTLSIVAVFLPVAFMGGIIGRFFFQFGVTVSCAVLLSMFVSFTLDPMLSSIWHDPHVHGERGKGLLSRLLNRFEQFLERLTTIYSGIIEWALTHRRTTMAIALASLLAALYLVQFIGKEFVPEPDLSELTVKVSTPVGSSLPYTEQKAIQIDQILRRYPEVIATYATINSGMDTGKNRIGMRVKLKPKNQRELTQKQLVKHIRSDLARVAGITIGSVAAAKESVSGGMKPIMISLQGTDLDLLRTISQGFIGGLQQIPGIVDIESSMKDVKPMLALEVNRDAAADLGVSVNSIGATLRPLLAGDAVTTWKGPDGENYDVRVRLDADARKTAMDVGQLYVASQQLEPGSSQPRMVQINQVATLQEVAGAAQISRRNLFREVLITANVKDRPAGDIQVDIDKLKASMKLPAGYRFQTEGQNKDMAESIGFAGIALALAVIFIYMVLGSQFNSFLHPISIMTSLPLSLIGVFLALKGLGSTLNIFSIIGMIMLMGLVTKNAILLIDFIKEAVARGETRRVAILSAGRTRLRPILMTTSAMVMGMLPLALGLGEGAEQRAPMAHALIGGLITSTLLTLVVVPVVYTYFDDLSQWLKRILKISAP